MAIVLMTFSFHRASGVVDLLSKKFQYTEIGIITRRLNISALIKALVYVLG